MNCLFCQGNDTRVVDTRVADDGISIKRRRECIHCHKRFNTVESVTFLVLKRSGAAEPFSREKVVRGVLKACQGRPVSEHDLAVLAQRVEDSLRATGRSQVSSDEVGKAILPYLRDLDVVAYLRFASVYSDFETLDDFVAAIDELRTD